MFIGTLSWVPEFRRMIGVLLRFPVAAFLSLFWIVYIWPWIAGGSIVLTVGLLILRPLLYLILWPLAWLLMAFENKGDPVLPDYWNNYPDSYLNWCGRCLRLGFPTMRRWLREAWRPG